jgi:hypothetical protein
MKLFCIDPIGLARKVVYVEAETMEEALEFAAAFIGVVVVKAGRQRDAKGVEYVQGFLGNGVAYTVFDARLREPKWLKKA